MLETLKLKEFEKECIITLPEGSVTSVYMPLLHCYFKNVQILKGIA